MTRQGRTVGEWRSALSRDLNGPASGCRALCHPPGKGAQPRPGAQGGPRTGAAVRAGAPPPGAARGCEDRPGPHPGTRGGGGACLSGSPGPALRRMSRRGGRRPGPRLCWLLWCGALLSPAAGYVIVSSVSWAVTNEVDEELDGASTEETLPALLGDSGSLWQRSFPASAHKEDAHLPPAEGAARSRPPPAPPGMFSYPREGGARLRPGIARFLAHASAWGCLATVSAHEKVSRPRRSRVQGRAWRAPGTRRAWGHSRAPIQV